MLETSLTVIERSSGKHQTKLQKSFLTTAFNITKLGHNQLVKVISVITRALTILVSGIARY
jgi:hypothetical protein